MKILFDIKTVPFSYHGSWMAISIPRPKDGALFLRNFHYKANDLFPLQMLVDGEPLAQEIKASPWLLTLANASGEGTVEICFESPGTVRLRGRGVELKLGQNHMVYSEAPNHAVINLRAALRRYQLEALHGELTLHTDGKSPDGFAQAAVISPASDGCWELAIDEFWSTWKRPERLTFDECLANARQAFEDFLDTMPAAHPQDEDARTLAAYINWSFTVNPCGLIKRPTLLMSKNWMSNVWSWDQCFNAMALAAGQPTLAMDQMLTLVDHQDEFGCYPDAVNDLHIHYNYSKPPVHGWTFGEMLKRLPEPPSTETLTVMYQSLSRQANWWLTHRCQRPGAGGPRRTAPLPRSDTYKRLPYYLHGNDSGWDNSTMFSQGVPLISPDLSALLILQTDVLAELAGSLDRPDEATVWQQRADELYALLIDELWCGDHFVARLANTGEPVESQSLIPWLPIILGKRLPADIQQALKTGLEQHLTEWGLATEKVDSPRYRENGYWQGPIWAPSTYIAVTGLKRCGLTDLADTISERFCRMCGKSGFAENFNALTGAPLCDPAYTWTASVFLLLAGDTSSQ